jgi:hypothetical protein
MPGRLSQRASQRTTIFRVLDYVQTLGTNLSLCPSFDTCASGAFAELHSGRVPDVNLDDVN